MIANKSRRENMAPVKNKNTQPEIILRKLIHSLGYRFRLHNNALPCTPDIWLKKYKTAIFVNGCFWHRHKGCTRYSTPKTNITFWQKKFNENVKRDMRSIAELEALGINVLVIWECEILSKSDEDQKILVKKLKENLVAKDNNCNP